MKFKDVLAVTGIPVVVASLCCLAPIVVVLAGLGTITFASSLADTLYGDYKWVFRGVGLVLVAISIVIYARRQKGICTIDDAVRRRNELLNIIAISLATAVAGYFFFLYIVVHYAGVYLGLWQ